MSYKETIKKLRQQSRRGLYLLQATILLVTGILPLAMSGHASAGQITARSATIDQPNENTASVQFAFGYTVPTTGTIQSITYNFCTTALGTCTLPVGLVANTGVSHVSQTGFPNNATAFAVRGTSTNSNSCLMATASWSCYTRTEATTGTGAVTHTITGVHAPTTFQTVYVRIVTYSDTAYLTPVDSGTVAVSFNKRYTINARVQEALTFCVGSILGVTVDDATTQIVPDCSTATGTSIDLGNITPAAVAISPVAAATGGDAKNAYVMLTTNGQGGTTVGYRAVQDGANGGKLKVVSAVCSGTTTTDQCFNSSAAQAAFTAGTENFGMTVAGTNCGSVPGAAYSCTYTAGTQHLKAVSGYQGQGTFGSSWTYGTGNGFKYDDSGSLVPLASTATSGATAVVANEALILKFAATAQVTTPTGVYQAQIDYIATPTF